MAITIVNSKIPYNTLGKIYPRESPKLRLSELVCLLHSLTMLVSYFFLVANAGQPTSFLNEALYTSIGGAECKNFPLSVVRI